MRRLRRSLGIPVAVGAAALLLAACGGSGANGAASKGKACAYKFAVITHGDNGTFWAPVYKGARDAAANLGCKLTEVWGSQQQGQAEPDDIAENAQIENAVNQHVDGIAISDHDPSLLNPTLASAAARGIPIVLLNSGCDNTDIAASKAITCLGQPEVLAGEAAGRRFAKLGTTNVLCVIHQSGQNLLDRCNGMAQGLGAGSTCKTGSPPSNGPACTEITISVPNAASNPQQVIGIVTSYLLVHPKINAVMSLSNAIATALVTVHPKNVKIATFDLNVGVQTDITNKSMAFAVDQRPYLQGYLPVRFLYLKRHEGKSVGRGRTVATGPLIVDSTDINKIAAAIAAGDD